VIPFQFRILIFSGTENLVFYTVTVLLHHWCKIRM